MDWPRVILCTALELLYLQSKWAALLSYSLTVAPLAEVLPMPDGRLTMGLDRSYVHACEGGNRKVGWFEVMALAAPLRIAGKSISD